MTKGEEAKALFEKGYNCSQAVILAFSDRLGIDRETCSKLFAGFGGGFGRLREVCGAVSGMTAVISYFRAVDDPEDRQAKAKLYADIQQAIGEFKAEFGSFICREILAGATSEPLPEQRTPAYYKKRPCPEYVELAANIAEKYISDVNK